MKNLKNLIFWKTKMKFLKIQDYLKLVNPNPAESFRPEIITSEDKAFNMGGMLGILAPNTSVPYHYHKKRESVIIVISGKGTEIIEGKEFPIKEGDIIFIPAGEKHRTINNSKVDLRYIEFFTNPPLNKDFVAIE